ncbi:hypothetical protein MJ904_17385 [Massilia sp. MB5]|uniref:CHASE2 domain-containing sensor protein n=1 Tax=Pseudoduganella violacea TaxID=1715466 RepID=A0A7W5FSY6_9BURK|nr:MULTISPECIES: hypothetical protein [Telluria group]MBB3118250.1 CHASE2 domain-containing sensor protein [Pseudoduganella violacea]UMR28878.1 hypothetical protein MJ904_17385 [Massilia sp. MB5]
MSINQGLVDRCVHILMIAGLLIATGMVYFGIAGWIVLIPALAGLTGLGRALLPSAAQARRYG